MALFAFDPSFLSTATNAPPSFLIPGIPPVNDDTSPLAAAGITMTHVGAAGQDSHVLSNVIQNIYERGIPTVSQPLVVFAKVTQWTCGFNEQWLPGQPIFSIDPAIGDIEHEAILRLGDGKDSAPKHQNKDEPSARFVTPPQLMAVLREGSRFIRDLTLKYDVRGGQSYEAAHRYTVELQRSRGNMPIINNAEQPRAPHTTMPQDATSVIAPWASETRRGSASGGALANPYTTPRPIFDAALDTRPPAIPNCNVSRSIPPPSSSGSVSQQQTTSSSYTPTSVSMSGPSGMELMRRAQRTRELAQQQHRRPQQQQSHIPVDEESIERHVRNTNVSARTSSDQGHRSTMIQRGRRRVITQQQYGDDDDDDDDDTELYTGAVRIKSALRIHPYDDEDTIENIRGQTDWKFFGVTIHTQPEYEWGAPHLWRRFAALNNGIAWYGNIVQIRRSVRFAGIVSDQPKGGCVPLLVEGQIMCPHYWSASLKQGDRIGFIIMRTTPQQDKKIPYIIKPWSSGRRLEPAPDELLFRDHSGSVCVGVYMQVGVALLVMDTPRGGLWAPTAGQERIDEYGVSHQLPMVYPEDYALYGRSLSWHGVNPTMARSITQRMGRHVLVLVIS